jgi:hypothetical protein
MKTFRSAALALLGTAVLCSTVNAQPGYPPPPPPDYTQPPDQGYPPSPGTPYPNDPNYPGTANPNDPGYPSQGYPPDQGYNGGPAQGYDQPYDGSQVDTGFFYNQLAPYGEWIERPAYGWVWSPRGVAAGWRPYTNGHWAYTDDGWAWVSSEPWGWAAYHYGRWYSDPDYGWLWVPGQEWAPSWVTWHEGNGYVGWAPLPPRARWRVGFGLDLGGRDLDAEISPWAFSFVPEREILAPRVERVMEPPARNATLIRNTRSVNDYAAINNRVINRGVPVNHVSQVVGQPIRPVHIESVTRGVPSRVNREQGGQVTFFRPNLRAEASPRTVAPPDAARRYRPPVPPEQLNQRHQSEQQALDRYHQTQRQQLEQYHQRELSSAQAQASRQDVQQRHQAEMQAAQQQQQRDRQQLQARQQRERQAAQQAQRPPEQRQRPPQGRDNQNNQNQNNQDNQKNRDRRDNQNGQDNRPPEQRPPDNRPPAPDM